MNYISGSILVLFIIVIVELALVWWCFLDKDSRFGWFDRLCIFKDTKLRKVLEYVSLVIAVFTIVVFVGWFILTIAASSP